MKPMQRRNDAKMSRRLSQHDGLAVAPLPALGARCRRCCALALRSAAASCETCQRGYVLPGGALEQIPIGASQEQVLIVLGTPSTVATVNGEAFYYISQQAERAAAFMPYDVVDQRVVAVYFDKDRQVARLANYGIKDGKIFDFVSQTTADRRQQTRIICAASSGTSTGRSQLRSRSSDCKKARAPRALSFS